MDPFLFLAVLSVLVFVHELGHFLVAKRAGIKVLEFGFGIPPRIWGKKIGETIYSLNLLPIGGFVRLFGEDVEDIPDATKTGKNVEEKRAYYSQPIGVRTAVLSAGVVMNLLLGVVIFSGLFTVMGIPTPVKKVQVIGIAPGSPVEEIFKLEDEIVAVAGTAVFETVEFKDLVEKGKGENILFQIERKGEKLDVSAMPRENPPEGEGSLGVIIAPKIEFVHYAIWQMPFRGIAFGLKEAYSWGMNIVSGIGTMVTSAISGKFPSEIGGPFEIYFLISEVAEQGAVPLLQLMGVLSVNLAIINLLPIPALDGGRLAFILFELTTGKRINSRVERITNAVGLAFLIALLVAITVQDVMRRFDLKFLGDFLKRDV